MDGKTRPSLSELLSDYDERAPLAEASTIPSSWYTDARVADLERRAVFGRTWQLFARADQLREPGCYVTGEVAGEPVVAVRGDDGALRAFYNVCRHHAAAVMTAPSGQAQHLRCPYHGWTYALDGTLRGVPDFAGVCNFDRARSGLVPIGIATWENLVFVNLDPNALSLPASLGDLGARVAPLELGALHFAERRTYTLACNWKVFVDNYLDGGYHVPHLHKGLGSILKYSEYTIENGATYCVQSAPIDAEAGEAAAAPLIPRELRQGQAFYYWIYPNLMLNWYHGYLDTNLVIPLGIDKTLVIFDFYFDDVSESARERNQKSIAVSDRIQDEDHAICESVQRGLSSRAYRAGRLSVRREAGEHLFHRLLARDLRSGRTNVLPLEHEEAARKN